MSAPAAPQDIVDAEAVIPKVIEQGGIDRHGVEALGVAIVLLDQALAELRVKMQKPVVVVTRRSRRGT